MSCLNKSLKVNSKFWTLWNWVKSHNKNILGLETNLQHLKWGPTTPNSRYTSLNLLKRIKFLAGGYSKVFETANKDLLEVRERSYTINLSSKVFKAIYYWTQPNSKDTCWLVLQTTLTVKWWWLINNNNLFFYCCLNFV